MIQVCQDLALALESLQPSGVTGWQPFNGRLLSVLPVGAVRQIDLAHAAPPQRADHGPDTNMVSAGQGIVCGFVGVSRRG